MSFKLPGNTEIRQADLADLLFNDFRYAPGRRTYVTLEMATHLRTYWLSLPRCWQELVQREIREAIASGCAGDRCDVESWQTVLELPLSDTAK